MAYLYLAKQIGLAGAFGLWAYVVAKGLFARTSLRLTLAEEVALLVPAGLAVAIVLLFGLGLVGGLTAPGILAAAALALIFACWRLQGRIARGLSETIRLVASRETPSRLVMIAIAGTVLLPVALNGLAPPHHSDEVRYHLPYALHFVEQGRIVPNLDLRFPFFTLNVNLLYAAAIVFGDDVTPHYVHLLLGTLAGLALYVLAVPACGRVTAMCAVMLFFVTPNFREFASTAYIDLGLAAFVTATIACLDRARERPALVVCAGLAFGAALGSKYLALALVPILLAWAAYRTRVRPQVVRFAAVAVLTGAPWYVYNLIWTGNPVWPFAAEWFGAWPWTAEDLASQIQQLTRERHERSLAGLLSLPYYLVTDSWRFSIPAVPDLLVPGLVALALLPWWNRDMQPYGIIVLVTVVAWHFTTPYFRYLTAIVPVWCLVSVWSVERTLWLGVTFVACRHSFPEAVRTRASYAAAAVVIIFAEYHFWLHNRWLDGDAIAERVVHRDRFLRERIPVYGVAEHFRRSGVRDEVIFVFPPGALFSYVRANRIVGDYFGPMGYRRRFLKYRICPDRFLGQVQPEGVSLLVVSQKFLDRRPAWSSFFASQLTSEYADRHAAVFRIGTGTESPPESLYRESRERWRDRALAEIARPSDLAAGNDDSRIVPYFPVGSDGFVQAFVWIVNHSNEDGTVETRGVDDTGARYGPVPFALGAREARPVTYDDLVACGFPKDESGGHGDDGEKNLRLSFATNLDIEALGYIRTEDGFMTSTQAVARTMQGAGSETVHYVPFFNPGSNMRQRSWLRLINSGRRDAQVTIEGRDSAGAEAPGGVVSLTLPAGRACRLSALTLESGKPGPGSGPCTGKEFNLDGRFGDGVGKWSLFVVAEGGDVRVMSLLESPTGHLSNMSVANWMPTGRPATELPLDQLPDAAVVQVKSWGPRSSRVGEPFNVQPNGNSALWFRVLESGPNSDYKVYVGSQAVVTSTVAGRSLITASLTPRQSRRLVSTKGSIPIHLVDPARGKQLVGRFHVHSP